MIRRLLSFLNYLSLFAATAMFEWCTASPVQPGEPIVAGTDFAFDSDAAAKIGTALEKESGTRKIADKRHDTLLPLLTY